MNIKINRNLIFSLLFIYLLLAINSVPYLYHFTSLENSIKIIIGYSPFLTVIICIIFIYLNRLKIQINSINIFLLLYISYCLFQFPSLILSDETIFYHGFYWIVATISLPIYLIFISTFKNQIIYKLFNIMIGIMFALTLFFTFNLFSDLFMSPNVSFSFYGAAALDPNNTILNSHVPRSSGMSRFSVIFFILFHQISINHELKSNILKKFCFIISIFFLFCCFHFQSRLTILFVVMYGVFNLIPFIHSDNFLNRSKKIIAMFLVAIFIHISFPIIQAKIKFDYLGIKKIDHLIHPYLVPVVNMVINDPDQKKKLIEDNVKNVNDEIISYIKKTASGRMLDNVNNSGRIDLWKRAIKQIKTSVFFGKGGPLSDRIYIYENVSNLYLYSFLCGGIISFILISFLSFSLIVKGIADTFYNLEFKKKGNFYKKLSIYLIAYFIFRSLTENSFGIFSVDYFVFFISVFILLYNQKK